jgi:hypothetical protein
VRTGAVEMVSNAETGFFRPMPLADGRLLVLVYTAEGFVPATIDPKPLVDVSAVKFLGAQLVEKYPQLKSWQVDSPSAVDEEKLITRHGPYHPLPHNSSHQRVSRWCKGYKDHFGIGYHWSFLDPLYYAGGGLTVAYTPNTGRAQVTSARTSSSMEHISVGEAACRGIVRTSTTSSARPNEAAKALRQRPAMTTIGSTKILGGSR